MGLLRKPCVHLGGEREKMAHKVQKYHEVQQYMEARRVYLVGMFQGPSSVYLLVFCEKRFILKRYFFFNVLKFLEF